MLFECLVAYYYIVSVLDGGLVLERKGGKERILRTF